MTRNERAWRSRQAESSPSDNETTLVVVGSGLAGLTAALEAADRGATVTLVTAGSALSGSSWWAQGGIAAAIGSDDRPEYHAADTFAVGAGLNDRRAVGVLVEEGRRVVTGLVRSGVPFEGGPSGPDLGLEAGHGHRRILHANGGATGEAVSAALLARVLRHPLITLVDETPVDRLLLDNGQVTGIASGERTFTACAVLLATGGYAGLWGRSTNPPGNRGIGLYLAWQAGATLADLEFIQFHPTALALPGAPAYLLSEALRGEGALLVDSSERPVVDPLLPRDVLSRAITRHIRESGTVYLSLRHLDLEFVLARFAGIAHRLRTWDLDLARDLLPVAPAAHYCMGGVRTDTAGRTGVPGLYVAGEAACTGAQGANRLASNSLLECLVFGRRAALAALGESPESKVKVSGPEFHRSKDVFEQLGSSLKSSDSRPGTLDSDLGPRLDGDLGVERDGLTLRQLVADLPDPETECAESGCVVSGLAARAALLREESRGAHYRTDWPNPSPAWQGRILWRRGSPPHFEEVHTFAEDRI